MCDDPLCQLTQKQLRRENERLQRKASRVDELQLFLLRLGVVLSKMDGVDAQAVFREATHVE